MKPSWTASRPAHQQGMALVEALIASAVLAIGLLGAAQLALKSQQTATENRQNTVGQMLALEAMDCLQAQAQVQAHTPTAACPAQQSIVVQGTRYTRQAQISPQGQSTDLLVQVSWPHRRVGSASSDHSDPQITWRSSVSNLPSWVGVSSP
jgi:Tfp pilus assembly protein PilV